MFGFDVQHDALVAGASARTDGTAEFEVGSTLQITVATVDADGKPVRCCGTPTSSVAPVSKGCSPSSWSIGACHGRALRAALAGPRSEEGVGQPAGHVVVPEPRPGT